MCYDETVSDVFHLYKVYDRIYMLSYPNQFDVSMTFLRYQEFYESPTKKFRGQQFTIDEYMRWYAVDRPGASGDFTYASDWTGFNLPSHIIKRVFEAGIIDENPRDRTMRAVYETVNALERDVQWYLIGCVEHGPAIEHELAHGLWHVDEVYCDKMTTLIENLRKEEPKFVAAVHDVLIEEGYNEDVIDDEIQAYVATGMGTMFEERLKSAGYKKSATNKIVEPFYSVFDEYLDASDVPWTVSR